MGSFALLGEFAVPPKTILVQGACNPEKDLVLLIHHSDARDTLSLWKLQGSKRWEVDVVGNFGTSSSLRHVSWSPNGDKFALSHSLQRLTVHDVLDGCEEFRYDEASNERVKPKMASIFWLKMPWKLFWDEDISNQPPPQLYPRDYDAPGSAFYVFKHLPQLDYKIPLIDRMNDEAIVGDSEWLQRTTAEPMTLHRAPRYMFPPSAHGWPSLPFNLADASISPTGVDANESMTTNDPKDRWYAAQSNTCLFAGDNSGGLYSFIHGTYYVGPLRTQPTFSQLVSIATGSSCLYFSRLCIQSHTTSLVLSEMSGRIYSHLGSDQFASHSDYRLRDIMRISTVAQDLALYASRNCGEAEIAWLGGGGQEGARIWNQKWCRLLDTLQSRPGVDSAKTRDVKTDLTFFLLTGMPLSPTLTENLEHGSQTTERNFKKWQVVVHETLMHVKHLVELSLLSLQRLVAVLWDLCGLAEIKDIAEHFRLNRLVIKDCIELAQSIAKVLSTMADTVRKEIQGFGHFMIWLRGLIPNLPPADPPLKPYDVLIVNDYIANGLYPSGIDQFFETSASQSAPKSTNTPSTTAPSTMQGISLNAQQALKDLRNRNPLNTAEPERNNQREDRRIRQMITTLIGQCNQMFRTIGESVTVPGRNQEEAGLMVRQDLKWKEIILPPSVKQSTLREGFLQAPRLQEVFLRERLIPLETGVDQLVLLRLPGQGTTEEGQEGQRLCILRLTHECGIPTTCSISCAMLKIAFPEDDSASERMENEDPIVTNILDAQFYDDKQLALVMQTTAAGETERRAIALLSFADQEYHPIDLPGPSLDVEADIVQRFNDGVFHTHVVGVTSLRPISMRTGTSTVSLSVNNKRGVAVILDHDRSVVHAYDLAGEEEEDATVDEGGSATPTEEGESMETS